MPCPLSNNELFIIQLEANILPIAQIVINELGQTEIVAGSTLYFDTIDVLDEDLKEIEIRNDGENLLDITTLAFTSATSD